MMTGMEIIARNPCLVMQRSLKPAFEEEKLNSECQEYSVRRRERKVPSISAPFSHGKASACTRDL